MLLFAFQGGQILAQPLTILLLAVPILIQVYFNAGLAYWLNKKFKVSLFKKGLAIGTAKVTAKP